MRKKRTPEVPRSKLKLKEHKGYWVAVGSVPYRLPDGTIGYRRTERGVSSSFRTKAEREAYVEQLNRAYEEQATSRQITFQRALANYVSLGHPAPLFAEAFVSEIGTLQCSEVDDTAVVALTKKLLPADAKPSYINRHIYTPILAILRMASKGQKWKPELTRPKGHKKSPPLSVPKGEWFKLLVPHLTLSRMALVAFLAIHGRRLGDALKRVPSDYDPEAGTLSIGADKNGNPLLIELLPQVSALFNQMLEEAEQTYRAARRAREAAGEDPDTVKKRAWLFGDGPTGGPNVRRDILVACARASGYGSAEAWQMAKFPKRHREAIEALSVPYFSPHAFGRHYFATRFLRKGHSLKHLQDAGGWASIEMPARRYIHLEKQEVTTAVHELGHDLAESQFSAGKAREEKRPKSQPVENKEEISDE